ncbi:tRNA-specific adenosine deaminase [uncultured archaeon]|nr:tRNA-specific adenosine deaminase [uncultured archaeon]
MASHIDDERFMEEAVKAAKDGIKGGQTPFGACVVKDGVVVSCVHNVVWGTTDITAHAEVNAIREACKRLNSIDLSGCVIYSTCEPCPMCFAACHWAKLDRIVYGATIGDAREAGFNELTVSNEEMKRQGGSPIIVVKGVLEEECKGLFGLWQAQKDKRVY